MSDRIDNSAHTAGNPNGAEGIDVLSGGGSIHELLAVLRRNVALLVLGPALAVAVGWFALPKRPTSYTATAAIQVLNTRRALTVGIEDNLGNDRLGRYADPLQSQAEIVRGRKVAGMVVDREGLRLMVATPGFSRETLHDVDIDPQSGADTIRIRFTEEDYAVRNEAGAQVTGRYGEPLAIGPVRFTIESAPIGSDTALFVVRARDAVIDRIVYGVATQPRKETDIVDISFTAPDPEQAQRIVNAVTEAARDNSVDEMRDRSRLRREFLEQQLGVNDSELRQAQLDLSSFRSGQTVYSSKERLEAGQKSLMDLKVQVEELNADRRMLAGLIAEAERSPSGSSGPVRVLVSGTGLGQNAATTQLYAQLVRYETTRDSLIAGGRTLTNPDVRQTDQLIASTRTRVLESARSYLASLDARAEALANLRSQSAGELRQLPSSEAEEVRLAQKVEAIRAVGDQLRQDLQRARMAEAVEAGQIQILYAAPVPTLPNPNSRTRMLLFALIFGLMVGTGAAFGREALDSSLRRRTDIPSALNLTELAVIPRIEPIRAPSRWRSLASRMKLAPEHDRAPSTEAYRTLRTNLIFSHALQELNSIAITSASPREGKSTTAVNLATAFAQQEMKVLLIDADLRRPSLHRALDCPNDPGLSSILERRDNPQSAVRRTAIEGLHFLPSGPAVKKPAELLGSAPMGQLITFFSNHFDLVIIDTPPLLAASDSAVIAALADGVIFVVHAGKTAEAAAQQALQQLQMVHARIIGAVLNDPDAQVQKYRDYHYSYGYYR